MSPLLCIDSEKLSSTNLENYSEATFAPDPNINTGSKVVIPDADLTSHQTVPKIQNSLILLPQMCLSNYVQRI